MCVCVCVCMGGCVTEDMPSVPLIDSLRVFYRCGLLNIFLCSVLDRIAKSEFLYYNCSRSMKTRSLLALFSPWQHLPEIFSLTSSIEQLAAVTQKHLRDFSHRKRRRTRPYFFSVSKKYPGKFVLAYQPARKPQVEYVSVTPDGFWYRNQTHSSVNFLVKYCSKPVPRPIPTMTAQVPTHITQNIDPNLYPRLQAAVDTAHQQRGASSTPYTPSGSIRPPLALCSTDSNPLPTLPTTSTNNRCTVAMVTSNNNNREVNLQGHSTAMALGDGMGGTSRDQGQQHGVIQPTGQHFSEHQRRPRDRHQCRPRDRHQRRPRDRHQCSPRDASQPTPPPRCHDLLWAAFLAPQLPYPQDVGLTGALLGHLYSMSEHLWLILMYWPKCCNISP